MTLPTHNVILQHAGYSFHFFHLQLAMRRFYHGQEFGISTQELSHTNVQVYNGQDPDVTLLFSVDAQISCRQLGLVLRVQEIMFVPSYKQYLMHCRRDGKPEGTIQPPEDIYICPHVTTQGLADIVDPVVRAHYAGQKEYSSTYTCDHCNTDARVEMCDEGTDFALVFTKLIDLDSISTPADPRWRALCGFPRSTYKRPGHGRRVVKNSTRFCFSDSCLETLRSRNIFYLKNERYKQVMHQSDLRYTWKLLKEAA